MYVYYICAATEHRLWINHSWIKIMLNEATAKPDDKARMGACSYHEFVSNDS